MLNNKYFQDLKIDISEKSKKVATEIAIASRKEQVAWEISMK